ncbi:MAG: helix-turn-helix domain-containing protein [Rhodobacteraceae bacterium]|nr:helix-turn-helix domain-containing protein [Paracoccaceae bacterium]
MSVSKNQFNPDYSVPPGWLLEITLEYNNCSQAEFARRGGISPKLIKEIISGKAPINSETAIKLEKTTGIVAEIWNRMESRYQSKLTMKKEANIT